MNPSDTSGDPLGSAVLLVSLITSVVALPPIVINLLRFLSKSNSAEELRVLRDVAEFAVLSVNQTMKTADGSEKLDAALAIASAQLAAYKIKVSPEQLRAIVEAAVWAAKAKIELPVPPGDDPLAPTITTVP